MPPAELRPLQGESPGPTRDGRRVLPARRIVLLLDAPLAYDVVYSVTVSGVTNLVGLDGGGGESEFILERPPPPEPAVLDSGAVADTGVVDTTAVVDTTTVIDTTGVVDTP
ncbi:MAG: hypothetical protein HKO77_03940 [Gemmatimonadetes bacterium]|nr:hypothetical protein [Gemmatimonadota bacterium]